MSNGHIRFMYLRNPQKFPVSCLCYYISKSDNRVNYGLSTFNPDDKVTFDRKFLREVAAGRMTLDKKSLAFSPDQCSDLHSILRVIIEEMNKDKTLPKRTQKAIKAWLIN